MATSAVEVKLLLNQGLATRRAEPSGLAGEGEEALEQRGRRRGAGPLGPAGSDGRYGAVCASPASLLQRTAVNIGPTLQGITTQRSQTLPVTYGSP